ncbi:SWI/SNF chromatin-remodeling complex subunit [Coemansia sp. RSA 2424]|nr:SWI/SNF chromatin-remodeling complex subunit [Coemansia sp. RSA 2424]
MAPSQPPPPPTVLAADKVSEVLDAQQQAQVSEWQRSADRITRANSFKVRETAIYQAREDVYRRVLEEQRQQNGAAALAMRREREAEKQQNQNQISGSGKINTGGVTLVMPAQRRPPAPGQLPTMRFSRRQLQRQAALAEVLVPIRIDIDADGHRLRDAFTWDLNNALVPPQRFALGLCLDLALPPDSFVPLIVQAIDEQLDDFRHYGHVEAAAAPAVRQSLLDEIDRSDQEIDGSDQEDKEKDDMPRLASWVDDELRVVIRIDIIIGHIALRDQLEWDVAPLLRPPPPPVAALLPPSHASDGSGDDDGSGSDSAGDDDDGQVPAHGANASAAAAAAVRRSTRLDRAIAAWASGALQGQAVTPEHVARVVCAERGLGGEFETAFAHAAREQLYAFAKSFLLAGYAHRPQLLSKKRRRPVLVDDRELARAVLAPVAPGAVVRRAAVATTFAPLIAHLHSVDVERLEKDADREVRRKRRQIGGSAGGSAGGGGRGSRADQMRGSNLAPNREAHRTNRTMIALPSWFADDLPPDTRSFVDVPGEGAHFLDAYDARAAHDAAAMAPPAPPPHIATSPSAAGVIVQPPPAADHDESLNHQHIQSSQLLHGRRIMAGNISSNADDVVVVGARQNAHLHGYASAAAAGGCGFAPVTQTHSQAHSHQSPLQQAREKLRNPTGRPRGRPSLLEKALRDAAARRNGAFGGAAPSQLAGRALEELCTRWRCMSCGVPPDRTPLIRRGPESMHSLCDECGLVFAKTRGLRDVDAADVRRNSALVCGPIAQAPDISRLPPPPMTLQHTASVDVAVVAAAAADSEAMMTESPLTSLSAVSATSLIDAPPSTLEGNDDDDDINFVDQDQLQK